MFHVIAQNIKKQANEDPFCCRRLCMSNDISFLTRDVFPGFAQK